MWLDSGPLYWLLVFREELFYPWLLAKSLGFLTFQAGVHGPPGEAFAGPTQVETVLSHREWEGTVGPSLDKLHRDPRLSSLP